MMKVFRAKKRSELFYRNRDGVTDSIPYVPSGTNRILLVSGDYLLLDDNNYAELEAGGALETFRILLESGDYLLLESGDFMAQEGEAPPPATTRIILETGDYILLQSGDYLAPSESSGGGGLLDFKFVDDSTFLFVDGSTFEVIS